MEDTSADDLINLTNEMPTEEATDALACALTVNTPDAVAEHVALTFADVSLTFKADAEDADSAATVDKASTTVTADVDVAHEADTKASEETTLIAAGDDTDDTALIAPDDCLILAPLAVVFMNV